MTCVNFDLSNAKMSFIWSEESGAYTDSSGAFTSSKNPRRLKIPSDSLEALTTYTFKVIGFMTDSPSINNSATIEVIVEQQDVVALITGGSYQQYGRDSSFTLDASNSYDPDESAGSFTYSWYCEADATTDASCADLTLMNRVNQSVPLNTLPVGDYVFTLMVVKGSRNDTAQVDIEIVAGAPPVISIAALTSAKYNTDEGFLSVESSISSTYSFTSIWSADSSDVTSLFVDSGSYVSTLSDQLNIVIALSILTEGNTYTLRLTATDSEDESSYSTVSFTINEPPSSGSVEVTPINGFALDTSFTFTATNWVDDDLPLTYIFGTTGVNDDGSLDTTALSPFGDERSDASYDGVTLSVGSNITNYTVGCFSEVIDSYGAVGSATTSVRVRTKALTVKQLQNISEAKARDSIDKNDADGSKQILDATSKGMKSTNKKGGSSSSSSSSVRTLLRSGVRSLLGSQTDEEILRASMLSNLWATYEITTITIGDVASLLSNLLGIVDTPSEVTYDVASGSHYFLQTILRATIGAQIGISTTSIEYVGESLTYIFETKWFNETQLESSSINAKNVTNVLSLTSSAQLYNAYDGVGYTLKYGDIDMYSYRTATSTLLGDKTISLSNGGSSSDSITSLYFNADTSDLITASGESSLVSTDLLDTKMYTLSTNLYSAALKGTYNSPAASASRLDLTGSDLNGQVLFSEPMVIRSMPAGMFQVTLAATVAFNTTFKAFDRTFACPTDGVTIDLNCPLTSDSHTCDHTAFGGGNPYYFEYTCPYVEPTCLYWDETTMDFEGDDCTLVSGYSTDAVTCECSRTGTFVLSGNTTQPVFEAFSTPSPTSLPTLSPTSVPTHIPTPVPTYTPTSSPTYVPTSSPSSLPTIAPTPLPTMEPTYTPTSLPTLKPSAAPTLSPTLKPTSHPTPSPTSKPTNKPSVSPTLSPSLKPTTSPTFSPTSHPTFPPTLFPTTSDTASVNIEISVTATGTPTATDETKLKATIVNQTGVSASQVKNLVITSSPVVRRLTVELKDNSRRLTGYIWTINFDIETDLSTSTEYSSTTDFASSINTQLSDSTFEANILSALPSVSSIDSLTTTANTRHPSFQPTNSPTLSPTSVPTMKGQNNGGGSSDAASTALIITLVVVGSLLLILSGMVIHKYFFLDPKKTGQVAPLPPQRSSSPSRANAYVAKGTEATTTTTTTVPGEPLTEDDLAGMLGQRETAEL
eukprot:CAMPEP_0114339650 /NCGR_PEP_ID=MMETSP0101-20121206/7864_1 /TAXON_ID=38822 ORGANISM="Pteridomonas danica, Strain PT" /NCGR_SAMPLE_ID=MMETSP0101 /ASSEMBLY_ACC=CAM_ASM_000211 /LENGTH=1211 /DNA_ID=CAMNT_0001472675 /DNA_START=790 /DNA_END=4425 /DNA_ORIENTATION=+